ncbi:hypothetical protein [Paenibacillus riograndensis]|uniref:Uncharacterized protein n=1 Tax=Paenibacillus riograndensis SBR5 TaxID=1073571 RepID=A0A0E4H693_9BACL|nr:hypothetical protein [Paenibacillus riograndensis]CQR51426.1 hypothetical protein PRIO_0196 [Paenibacillus riograndensis SBR5]
MKAEIKTTIKLIPHPEPQRLVDMWARIVVNEILKQEAAEKGATP